MKRVAINNKMTRARGRLARVALERAVDAVQQATPEEFAKKLHERQFGGFNDYPPKWEPIADHQFWHKWLMYGCGERYETRQMYKPKKVHETMFMRGAPIADMIEAKLYTYSDGTGLAIVPQRKIDGVPQSPRFYRFAICHHQYKMVASKRRHGSTVKVMQCVHCKDKMEIDSSD